MKRFAIRLFLALALAAVSLGAMADEIDRHLAAIAGVGPEGARSAEARAACDALSECEAEILPRLLRAMQSDNPVAANWYRSAYEAIVRRERAKPRPQLPVDDLQGFVRDPANQGRVRRLVLALCDELQPGFSAASIPTLLDDPEFRPDAVDAALAAGQEALEDGDSETARNHFHQAFEHARSSSRVVRASDKLAALGQPVDVVAHLGLVVDWWVIGPFDAPAFSGFERSFPPEQSIELRAEYTGQQGNGLRWVRHRTGDPLGLLNLVQALIPAEEAVGYAYAEIESPRAVEGQLRCGADDNCTVWLNGEKVFARNQWLNGVRFDRFVAPIKLQAGKNRVLVKVCQGPQHKNPQVPNNWSLYVRFCDQRGRGLAMRSMLPPLEEEAR